MTDPEDYSAYFTVEATGARIGLMTCLRCGVVVLLGDKDRDASRLHDAWHRRTDGEPPATTAVSTASS